MPIQTDPSRRQQKNKRSRRRAKRSAVVRWLKVMTLLTITSWIFFGVRTFWFNGTEANVGESGIISDPPVASGVELDEGPWGRLVCRAITISPMTELMPETVSAGDEGPIWHFPDINATQLEALFAEAGLSETLRESLLSMIEVDLANDGLRIRPTPEVVLGLDPEARSALYVILAEYEANNDQRGAFRFYGKSLDEWTRRSPLPQPIQALIEPLIYRHGDYLFFADLRTIESKLPSEQERLRLVKTLSHQRTYRVELQLTATSNLDELVAYWGRGGRANTVAPMLESAMEIDGEGTVDITYLLPSYARRKIYTYPVASEFSTTQMPDCHWAAMNFFNDEPDDDILDPEATVRVLKNDYYRIFGNLKFGDLVLYLDEHKKLIHSAVYIADDILFTKNGVNLSQPWMLIKMDEMKGFYPRRNGLEIRFYRRKNI